LTAACCSKRDFLTHTPPHPTPPPKKRQQTFVLHTQNSSFFELRTQKSTPKSRPQKGYKKAAKHAARKVGKKFIPEPVLLLS